MTWSKITRCLRFSTSVFLRKVKDTMFLPSTKWPFWFWRIFSISYSIDPWFNKWQVIYPTLLIISCVQNIIYTSKTVCIVEVACDSSLSTIVKRLFMKVIAITCIISRIVIFFREEIILYCTINIWKSTKCLQQRLVLKRKYF